MVSSKLSPENTEFLDEWSRQLKPLTVSQSSLVDLSVRIVRHLFMAGKLSLEPRALQEFLGTEGTRSTEGKGKP